MQNGIRPNGASFADSVQPIGCIHCSEGGIIDDERMKGKYIFFNYYKMQ